MNLGRLLISQINSAGGSGNSEGSTPLYFTSDNDNRRFLFPFENGYPSVTSYEYSTNSGTDWIDVEANPQWLYYGTYSANTVWLRRKGFTDIYKNQTAFTALTASNVGKINVLGVGDSNMAQTCVALDALLDKNIYYDVRVQGYAGWTSDGILTTVTEDVLRSEFEPAASRNILFYIITTNDHNNGYGTAQQIYDRVKAFHERAHKVGWVTIAAIPSYCPNPYSSGWAAYPVWETMMLNNWQTGLKAEALINNHANSKIGVNAFNGGNSIYWASSGGDPLHYTTLGYQTMAAETVLPAIESIKDRVRLIPATPSIVLNVAEDEMTVSNLASYYIPTKDLWYTQDSWATYDEVTTYPIPVDPNIASDQKGVQIKAINGNMPSVRVLAP